MARSIVVVLCTLAMLTALAFVPVSHAQNETGLQLVTAITVPNARDVKFPHVAARNGQVHVSGTVNRSSATYWTKAEAATDFSSGFGLGPSRGGLADYLVTSTAVAPDGAVYVAWTNLEQDRVYLRRQEPSGVWGPTRTVANANFPIFVEVGVGSDGRVFVAWNEPSRTARYRTSTDQGATWTGTTNLGDNLAYSDQMDIATSAGGQVAVSWTGVASGQLQVFVGVWNGGGFDIRRVSTLDSNYADATVTIAPDGKLYVAWRGTDGGVFYAERQADGSYPRSRLSSSTAEGLINVNADESGNLHFAWIARPGGGTQLFYAFKEASGGFRGPIAFSDGTIFNPHASASVGSQIYEHVVMEQFGGSLRTRYALFRAEGSVLSADPAIEDGAAVLGGKATASVNFRNVRGGAANQVRYRWGAAPTDTATDSGGWTTFSNPLSVPIPQSIRESTACQPSTLYTQVRNTATGVTESQAKQDAILVDTQVEGNGTASNPYLYISEDAEVAAELAGVAGALGGDPRYTRIPLMYISVSSDDDCTDLKSVGIGRGAGSIDTTLQITDEGYSGFVPLPGIASLKDGEVPVVLQISDGAGNRRNVTTSLVFDETKPLLDDADPGALTAEPNPRADLLQDLTFTDIKVSDAQYSQERSRGFWGVWLAVSRTPVANPAAADLNWVTVPVEGNATTFTVEDFSLASGLSASQVTAGNYYVYARFLDGAGNPTDRAISLSVTSSATRPELNLPLLVR